MLKPAMSELLANVKNRYLLVNLAAQRARDISEEALETGEVLNDKAVKLALDEIAAGTIHYCPGPKPTVEAAAAETSEMNLNDLNYNEDEPELINLDIDIKDENESAGE